MPLPLSFFFIPVFALVSGCGGEKDIFLVRGIVTYQDAPVVGATVAFIPEEPDGVMATGLTGSDGSYRLTSFGAKKSGSGAKAGSYRVSIVKREERSASEDGEAVLRGETTWEEVRRKRAEEMGNTPPRTGPVGPITALPPPVSLIPVKYASGDTSGLTATVENKSPNIFDFHLVD